MVQALLSHTHGQPVAYLNYAFTSIKADERFLDTEYGAALGSESFTR
jgi:hemolysin-activating ACP:hemolysin acyltransferase